MVLLHSRLMKRYQTFSHSWFGQLFAIVLTCVISFLMTLRMFAFIGKYAVDLLVFDEFDFMRPIFEHNDVWTVFTWQHGPHRQGVGGVISKFLMEWSGVDIRVEAFASAAFICLALVLVLVLKRLLFGRFDWMDILFPVTVLTLYQFELFVVTPNLAHSAVPLFLVFLYSVSWLIEKPYLKYAAVLVSNFLLVFTGFGVFMGVITVCLLTVDTFLVAHNKQRHQVMIGASALILVFATFAFFLWGYVFNPAVECFGFSPQFILKYPVYMALILSKFVGVQFQENMFVAIGVGLLLVLAMVAAMFKHGWAYLREPQKVDQTDKIIFILTGFSLLFMAFNAVGRVCLGMETAQSSRYMCLVIPGFVGMLFSLYTIQRPRLALALFFLAFILLGKTLLPFAETDQSTIDYFSEGKARWKECYLKTETVETCNDVSHLSIHHRTDGFVDARLQYFKQYHLNLYRDLQ